MCATRLVAENAKFSLTKLKIDKQCISWVFNWKYCLRKNDLEWILWKTPRDCCIIISRIKDLHVLWIGNRRLVNVLIIRGLEFDPIRRASQVDDFINNGFHDWVTKFKFSKATVCFKMELSNILMDWTSVDFTTCLHSWDMEWIQAKSRSFTYLACNISRSLV